MRTAIITLILATVFTLPLAAQTLQIPIGQQGDGSLEKPSLGMSREQVEAKFGEPKDWREAKGNPPISSWIYDDFVVYFEGDIVIHAVRKHRPNS